MGAIISGVRVRVCVGAIMRVGVGAIILGEGGCGCHYLRCEGRVGIISGVGGSVDAIMCLLHVAC